MQDTDPKDSKRNSPIGVFDSGVGGLSILHHIRHELPHENLLYVADTAHVPYGEKPTALVIERSLQMAEWIQKHEAKALVIACNTATAAAIHTLRQHFALPIVGIEPAVKPALQATRSGAIGVLATRGTLASDKFAELVRRFAGNTRVLVQPCPLWVEQVERGGLGSADTLQTIAEYTLPLIEQGVDTLVLGCTHFAFLVPSIEQIVGPRVQIVEPGAAVARRLRQVLTERELLSQAGVGGEEFFTSGNLGTFQTQLALLWGKGMAAQL